MNTDTGFLRRHRAQPVPASGGADGPDTRPDGTPSGDWTVVHLREYATEQDVALHGASTKADILAAIDYAASESASE